MENNSYLTKGRLGMNVKVEYAEQTNRLVTNVSMDTVIGLGEVEPLLERLSAIFRKQIILKRGKPKKGWKISTIVGYIHNCQDEFPSLE